MQISRNSSYVPSRPGARISDPERNVGSMVPNYTGPKDGLSQKKAEGVLRGVNRALIAGCFRTEVEGKENLPTSGSHVYTPTHPSYFDPPLVLALTDKRDVRSVANAYVFDGFRGHIMKWGGAFPVQREHATIQSVRHCVDVLKDGKNICIFPEGTIDDAHQVGKIGEFKRGAAWMALNGNAESIVPINVSYHKNTQERRGETLVGLGAALAVAGAGAAAAAFGGPGAQLAAGAIAGALAGCFGAGKVARDLTPAPGPWDQFPKYFAMLKGGAAGALLGALGGGALASVSPLAGAATGIAGALGVYGLAAGWRDRDIARLTVGTPLKVADYDARYPATGAAQRDDAVMALTEDLHRSIGRTQEKITGVPYDENCPKVRYFIEETLKVKP